MNQDKIQQSIDVFFLIHLSELRMNYLRTCVVEKEQPDPKVLEIIQRAEIEPKIFKHLDFTQMSLRAVSIILKQLKDQKYVETITVSDQDDNQGELIKLIKDNPRIKFNIVDEDKSKSYIQRTKRGSSNTSESLTVQKKINIPQLDLNSLNQSSTDGSSLNSLNSVTSQTTKRGLNFLVNESQDKKTNTRLYFTDRNVSQNISICNKKSRNTQKNKSPLNKSNQQSAQNKSPVSQAHKPREKVHSSLIHSQVVDKNFTKKKTNVNQTKQPLLQVISHTKIDNYLDQKIATIENTKGRKTHQLIQYQAFPSVREVEESRFSTHKSIQESPQTARFNQDNLEQVKEVIPLSLKHKWEMLSDLINKQVEKQPSYRQTLPNREKHQSDHKAYLLTQQKSFQLSPRNNIPDGNKSQMQTNGSPQSRRKEIKVTQIQLSKDQSKSKKLLSISPSQTSKVQLEKQSYLSDRSNDMTLYHPQKKEVIYTNRMCYLKENQLLTSQIKLQKGKQCVQ